MARMARVVVPNIPHHVTQRGNRRQRVFFGDDDYRYYKELLGRYCKQAAVQVLAYCLMPNHVHIVMVPRHERTGRPIGSEAFLDQMEIMCGRSLRPGRPGPKPNS
jgi:REP element-mobilizing transposase RayT